MFEIRKERRGRLSIAIFSGIALSLISEQGFTQTTGTPIATPTEATPTPTATPSSASTPGPQATLKPINFGGTGTITYGTTGCESNPGTCDLSASGTLGNKSKGGSFQTNFSVQWSEARPNGAGGLCAPAAGTIEFAPNRASSVNATLVGSYCEAAAGEPAASPTGTGTSVPGGTAISESGTPHTFTATYLVTGGQQEDASNAQGVGGIAAGDDGNGSLTIDLSGTLGFVK
jgi:hypothetical protein